MSDSNASSSSIRKWLTRPWLVAGLILVAALSIRVVISGNDALARGDAAVARGDTLAASLAYREAISWVFPIAPWRDAAAERLWTLAEEAQRTGRMADAVQAYSLLRAGFFAGRSIFGLDDTWREKIDAVLAPLMAEWEAKAARTERRESPGTIQERTAHYAAIFARDPLPSRAWGLLAVLGFFLWVGSAWRATALEGKRLARTLALSGVGLALFLTGVALA